MADQPIDIHKNKKDLERTEELKEALHAIYSEVIDHQNKTHMRVEDLVKDACDHQERITTLIASIYETYPELSPDLEEEEFE